MLRQGRLVPQVPISQKSLAWQLKTDALEYLPPQTTEESKVIVQVANKSLSFLIRFKAAWSVLPAYSGEIYLQISDNVYS